MNSTLSSNKTDAPFEDTFWQTLPAEPTLTDEQSDDTDTNMEEEMTRVAAQEFRFCREDQRIMMITPTAVEEAGPVSEGSELIVKENVHSSFIPINDSLTEAPEVELDMDGFVASNKECDGVEEASYKSTGTTSSDSTLPTISPPASENQSQHSKPKQHDSHRTRRRKSALTRKKSVSFSSKSRASSQSLGKTTISSTRTSPSRTSKDPSSKSSPKKKMTRSLVSCCRSDDTETVDGTVLGTFARTCESMIGPFFFDYWDDCDHKNKPDDATMATVETELSYEEDPDTNVLVAVQATVLGNDYPEALEPPNKSLPHVWGNNFVGLVRVPKGDTAHSRKFPPGSRVASISAWTAASHKPYIACNTSHLLPIPPIGGVHLDAPEVAVVVAAYLPSFQALYHGQRQKRVCAYTPTALEGQRVLILAHAGDKNSRLNQSLVDAQVQAAVRLALLAGARDVHVTVPKIGNAKKHIFGSDYRVRLLDTPPDDWAPTLKGRMDLILDYTSGSNMDAVSLVQARKGRYVGCVGEDCGSSAIHSRDEGPHRTKKSVWADGLALCPGNNNTCSSPLPEGKDLKHTVEWTTACINMENASLFDFYYSWKQDRRLVEHDFNFLLGLLARRHIRPHVAMILDVEDFPEPCKPKQLSQKPKAMTGAVVCEPWVSQTSDLDDMSTCSSL